MDPLRFKKKDKFDQIEKNSPNHLKSPKIENLRGAQKERRIKREAHKKYPGTAYMKNQFK
jgi:hypothetical protein